MAIDKLEYRPGSGLYDDAERRVASLNYGRTGISQKVTYEEQRTLGILFEAAPDLLRAARSTTERLADLPRYLRQNGHDVLSGVVADALEQLQAAIDKADSTTNTFRPLCGGCGRSLTAGDRTIGNCGNCKQPIA